MPSLNNENESEVDGDMSENESHSGSSRDAKDSSEADPDSDSSELDETECERRTNGYVKSMSKNIFWNGFFFALEFESNPLLFTGDLEHQFTILREQLYQERIKQIELNLNEVRNGRSQEYLEPLKHLTDTMQNRIEVAGILKRYRLDNINHKFHAEEQGAHQHFEV